MCSNAQWQEYVYSGDGQRVRRKVNGVWTWQIYGMGGELLAEYAENAAPSAPQKEYGYRNGQLLITAANGDEQRVSHFVEQLFLRAAVAQTSTNNAQLHVNTLANAGAQGETQLRTAAQTVVRQIYQASTLPAGDLVAALYLGVLQRYGDAGGLAYWTSVAQSDRNGVIEAFVTSGEFYERVQVLFGRELSDTDRTDNFTKYLYTVILNRSATLTEREARRAAVDGASALGQSAVITNAKDFVRSLFNSAEYAGRGRTDAMFVSDLYYACLRYAPDGNGWSYWTGQVGSQGRAAVLEVFLNAGPFDVQAGALYREVLWLVADHLGTPRMIAERTGQPAGIKHHDYLPFGEELFSGIAGRDASHGYGATDSARQQFTGYERDDETGLDYAQARYYSSVMGRFVSVDPLLIPAASEFPQRWNRYVYCLNNPFLYTDPSGMIWLQNSNTGLYLWVNNDEYKEGNKYYDNLDWVPVMPDQTGPSGITFTLEEGTYVNEYSNLVNREVYLGRDGRLHATEDCFLNCEQFGNELRVRTAAHEEATLLFAVASFSYGYAIAGTPIVFANAVGSGLFIASEVAKSESSPPLVMGSTGRAPEYPAGQLNSASFPDAAMKYLGPGYREASPGRYVSADGMRQVRFGAHETRGSNLHAHFEAYDTSGGKVIENSVVKLKP